MNTPYLLRLVTFCGLAATLHAQTPPLTPSGPPSDPTTAMKSLNQVEPRTIISSLPYTISQSGSYYLTSNLVFGDGLTGISISANDVTLDLGGFTLQRTGSAGEGVISTGVAITGSGVTVRNGHIDGAGAAGRRTNGVTGSGGKVIVEDITVRDCADSMGIQSGYGITVSAASRITRCHVIDADRGVTAGLIESCVLEGSKITASGNVKNCTVSGATIQGDSVTGCKVTTGSIENTGAVSDCVVASGNILSSGTVTDCVVTSGNIQNGGKVSGCKVTTGFIQNSAKVSDCVVTSGNIENSTNVSGCTVTSGLIQGVKLALDCYVDAGASGVAIDAKLASRCTVTGTSFVVPIIAPRIRDCVSNNAVLPDAP